MKKFFRNMALIFAASAFIFASCENDSTGSGGSGSGGGEQGSGISGVQTPSAPVNATGSLTATGGGWLESAWLEWVPYQTDSTYNVYVKGENLTDWTKLDKELIRGYSNTAGGTSVDYFRADALGLKAGTYEMKVEVAEDTSKNATAANIKVVAHDRTGFAFHDGVSPGAYRMDGTLKGGAKVLYVSKDNCNTITMPVITDSKGNTTNGIGLGSILALKQKGYDKTPWAIRIIGTISASDIDSTQLLSDEDGLQLKGNKATDVLNVTLEGVGEDAVFHGFGMTFFNGTSCEMRNIGLLYFNQDGVQIKGTCHIWIHNLDVFYGQKGSAADQKKGDGSLDAKDNSQYTTFSYLHFWDSGKMSLCGMKSESGPNYMTYHHNWFDHSDSRHPRVRTMTVHIYNNYYDGNAKYGAGATLGADLFVENNYFRNCKFPMLSSLQGNDVYAGSSVYKPEEYGTFSKEAGGSIKSWNNKIVDTNNNTSYWAYGKTTDLLTKGQKTTAASLGIDTTKHFDAWEASSRDEKVPETMVAFSGGDKYSNFDTDSRFYIHSLITESPEDAKETVEKYSGRMRKPGKLSEKADFYWDLTDTSQDKNDAVIDELSDAIKNYKSKTVKSVTTNSSVYTYGTLSDDDLFGGTPSTPTTPTASVTITTSSNSYIYTCDPATNTDNYFTISGTESSAKNSQVIAVNDINVTKGNKNKNISFTTNGPVNVKIGVVGGGAAATVKITKGSETIYTSENLGTSAVVVEKVLSEGGIYTIERANTGKDLYIYCVVVTPES